MRHRLSIALLLAAGWPVGAQSLARRIAAVNEGTVLLAFASRPGVCSDGRETVRDGRVVVVFPSMFGYGRSDMSACITGPVRVSVGRSDGETVSLRVRIGGRSSAGDAATDLGTVSAPDAARYFLREAQRLSGHNADYALAAAVFADSVDISRDLVDLARSTEAHRELRQRAVFWLGTLEEPGVARALRDLAADAHLDEDVRSAAIIAIGRDDISDEDVARLERLYPSASSKLRDAIFLAVSRSDSPRASGWLTDVVTNRDESRHNREQAMFWLGQGQSPTSALVKLYDRLDESSLRTHYTFVLSQRRDRAALDQLIAVAEKDPDRGVRKQALFWLGQSKDPRALDYLRDLVTR